MQGHNHVEPIAPIICQRLMLMWCFVLINQFKQINDLDGLLKEVSENDNPVEMFNDIFVPDKDGKYKKKIRTNDGNEININSIRLNNLVGITHDEFEGKTYSISEGYCLFEYEEETDDIEIIFPIYCFALANIFFHPSNVIERSIKVYYNYTGNGVASFINPLCFNDTNSIVRIGVDEKNLQNCSILAHKRISITKRPEELETLPRLLREQINIFRKALELNEFILPEQEKDRVMVPALALVPLPEQAQSSCMRCVITGILCFLAVVALVVMFAAIFPNAFAFIHFPHLINNAFLGCVISTGIVGGLSFIFSITRIICTLLFHEIIWNKTTRTDSWSSRFLCKALGGYPSETEKQIDRADDKALGK
jgi:hypothetical protein